MFLRKYFIFSRADSFQEWSFHQIVEIERQYRQFLVCAHNTHILSRYIFLETPDQIINLIQIFKCLFDSLDGRCSLFNHMLITIVQTTISIWEWFNSIHFKIIKKLIKPWWNFLFYLSDGIFFHYFDCIQNKMLPWKWFYSYIVGNSLVITVTYLVFILKMCNKYSYWK